MTEHTFDLPRRLAAETLGTALLVATVVGSGIMAETLTKDVALALLCNTLPTGAILVVLITLLGPVSGAHFNPAVSAVFALRRELVASDALLYIAAQVAGGIVGTIIAHAMFDMPLIAASVKMRTGGAQWFSEAVAAFGLIVTILGGIRFARDSRAVAGRSLYYGGLLVHRLDLLRQSGGCDRKVADQHLFRHQASRPARLHRRRVRRRPARPGADDVAVGAAGGSAALTMLRQPT